MSFYIPGHLLPRFEGARHGYYRPGSWGSGYYDPPHFERFYKPTENWGVRGGVPNVRLLRASMRIR